MRYSFLLDDKYKFNANVRDKDHKITKIHHFVAWYKHSNVAFNILMLNATFECCIQHSNVTFNIRMLQHSKVHSNVEHSFMH